MRLINTRSLKIHEFLGKVPPYAILSHTWGREEVTYQDFSESNIRERKSGYAKIRATCSLARQHGLDYAWVDTCCIDKTSSAELGEAINSMFRWYQQSSICYAFLEDVTAPHTGTSPRSLKVGDVGFGYSRWFSRGWTLQELIAPGNVEFYNRNWHKIGEKSSLADQLEEITGIDTFTLKGESLAHVSIGNRMSWASRRETTRPEDVAYSLLGIFNVNMPLVYGEGPRAFQRLQEEILRQSDDHTLFAWQASEAQSHENPVTGLFATSPSQWSHFLKVPGQSSTAAKQQIIRAWDYKASRSPITLTNKGISMTARVVDLQAPLPRELMVLVLNCAPEGNPFRMIGIYIRHQKGDRYARIRPDLLVEVEMRDEDLDNCEIHGLRSTEDVRGHHYDEPWTSSAKIYKELVYEATYGSLGEVGSVWERYKHAIYMDKSLFRRSLLFDSYSLQAIFTGDGGGHLRFFRFDTEDHADVVIKSSQVLRVMLVLRSRMHPADIILIPLATSKWDGEVLSFNAVRVHADSLAQSPRRIMDLYAGPWTPAGKIKRVRLSNNRAQVKVGIKPTYVLGIPMQAVRISRPLPTSMTGFMMSVVRSMLFVTTVVGPLLGTVAYAFPSSISWASFGNWA